MGGGDLNLKKSWHPHTMKNQEKVWKAEQAKNAEEMKLKDLRKEIAAERNREELTRMVQSSDVKNNDKKLEWMYKSSTEIINREEYLLGRTIDRSFEKIQEEEKLKEKNLVGVKVPVNHVEHDCVPFSIRAYRNVDTTEQVDLQRKVMEDPLMLIKQKEMESRRKLLENPVKLKELHRILKIERSVKEQTNKPNKSKKNKKSSKSKKKKKRRRHESSSSSSETESSSESRTDNHSGGENLDELLEKRYKKLKGSLDKDETFTGINLTKLLDAKYETISKELNKAAHSKKKSRQREKDSRSGSISDTNNDERYNNNRRQYKSRENDAHCELSYSRYSRNVNSGKGNKNRRSRSRSLYKESRYRHSRRSNSKSRSPVKTSYAASKTKTKTQPATKTTLSEKEKEQRRREMMNNAVWRDEERTKYVHKHREEYLKEEEQNKSKDFDKEFINKQVKRAISTHTSVGSRIRSNLNNIQRTSAAMNTNFAKK